MGILTVFNNIAMGIGYIVLLLVILFLLWLLIDTIKLKQQRQKWEKDNADRKKAEEIVAKENAPSDEKTGAENLIKTHTEQNTIQSITTEQTTTQASTENKELSSEEKESSTDKEKLIDNNGKIKMVG